jgi:hypothetical protein
MKKYLLCICFLTGAFINESYSQLSGKLAEYNIANERKNELLDSISKLLFQNYFFPDMADKMSAILKSNQEKGKYAEAVSSKQFAKVIMQDLKSVSKDKHILITNSGNPSNQIKNNTSALIDTSYGISKVDILPGNIGYMKSFIPPASPPLIHPIKFGKGVV